MPKEKPKFPKDFFTQARPHLNKNANQDDPKFKWEKSILEGKTEIKIVSLKKEN